MSDATSILVVGSDGVSASYEAALKSHLQAKLTNIKSYDQAMACIERATDIPDLVMLAQDPFASEGGALTFLRAVKSSQQWRYIPVIAITAQMAGDDDFALLDRGAEDFIESGSPPEIMIARVKAQLRHKVAVDRLERMALDRDLFAAGVLHDISGIKNVIITQCRTAKGALKRDPKAERGKILDALAVLTAHAERLGSYAADVIQSVRQTHRQPDASPQDLALHLKWVEDMFASSADASAQPAFTWQAPTPLVPVLGDASFLRLALLNVVQRAISTAGEDVRARLEVTQERALTGNPREKIVTRLRDFGAPPPAAEIDELFRPFARHDPSENGLGLALVARVVARMDGRVWAEAPGDGAQGVVLALELPSPR